MEHETSPKISLVAACTALVRDALASIKATERHLEIVMQALEKVSEGLSTPVSPMTAGTIVVDSVRRRASASGQAVLLRPQEFAVLSLLHRYYGCPVPYQRIEEHLWQENDFIPIGPLSRIHSIISCLNTKLEKVLGYVPIHNHPKYGYELRDDREARRFSEDFAESSQRS